MTPRSVVNRIGALFPSWFLNYGVQIVCGIFLVLGVGLGGRYEADFRSGLERGFQHRVELGDLASSVQQLRRSLEVPRILDPTYAKGLAEKSKELEVKSKVHSSEGRVSELPLPSKELDQIIKMEPAFERLSVSAAIVERAQALKVASRAPDSSEFPGIKKFSLLVDQYIEAVSALRNSNGAVSALQSFSTASMGLGENIPIALTESRRKGALPVWRDMLTTLGAEKSDAVDRYLSDARAIDEFQSLRGRAISKLEQIAARVDGAERMLLQSRATGGLLVVASLLTWAGVLIGLMGMFFSMTAKRELLRKQSALDEVLVPRSVMSESLASEDTHITAGASIGAQLDAPTKDLNRPAPLAFEDANQALRPRESNELSKRDGLDDTSLQTMVSEPITSGYWISSGSMVERRVALLDRQSEQLERHVKSVMASAESLASRADLVLQSLQLMNDIQPLAAGGGLSVEIHQRVETLQALSMNLALNAPTIDLGDPLLDYLEEFNDELAALSEEIRAMSNEETSDSAHRRRVQASIDEGRRLSAAADSLRERTETLYEDAQRFRRHSEALIRGIQDGAISEVSASALKARLISN